MKERLYRLKRNIQKKINSFYYQYTNNRYAIAFRQRTGKALYENESCGDGFILIKSTLRYWMADPFLIKHNGVNYLFAELYDKKHSKGVIGYAKLKGNRCGKFRICLKEKYHLSYPCIFQRGNDLYMMPETKDNNEATLYKAIDFPKKWTKFRTVCKQPCVDTTPFCYQNENYYFTTIANEHSSDDNLFLINEKSGECKQLLKCNLCLRSAGNVIFEKDNMIRPSQDDTVYGDAVIFNRVVNFSVNSYEEIPFKRVLSPNSKTNGENVCVSLLNNTKKIQFNGLHTYNVNNDYEVIDLRYPRLKKRK
ncbi:MAG: hypothetical protein IKJ41_10755 [Clostridia bacterium]|nr:hypothetical protein [Clostridia bacterium]